MTSIGYLIVVIVLLPARWLNRGARGLSLLGSNLQDRGLLLAAARLFRLQQMLECLSTRILLSMVQPGGPDAIAKSVASGVRGAALLALNGANSQLRLRCLAAYSGYAWTPTGVAALLSRSVPPRLRVDVFLYVEKALQLWGEHNGGVFEVR